MEARARNLCGRRFLSWLQWSQCVLCSPSSLCCLLLLCGRYSTLRQRCTRHPVGCQTTHIYIFPHSPWVCFGLSAKLFWSVLVRPNFLCWGHSLPSISLGGRLDHDRLTSDGPSVASRCNRRQQVRFEGVEYPCRPQQLVVFRISQMGRRSGAHQERPRRTVGCHQQYRHGVKRSFCEIAEVPRGRVVFAEVPHSQNTRTEHCQSLLSKANPVGLNKESNY